MRHRVKASHFNMDANHRKQLLRGLVRNLILTGEITTTVAKAKETSRLTDKLIYKATTPNLEKRRLIHRFFGVRDVVNTLVDKVAPLYVGRVSGFTRVTKIGKRRGDNTQMASVSLVIKPERLGTLKPDRTSQEKKTKAKTVAPALTTASKLKSKSIKKVATVKPKPAAKSTKAAVISKPKISAKKAVKKV